MSTMKLDRWLTTSNGAAVQTLVQLQTHSTTLISSYEGSYDNINRMGAPQYNDAPVYNKGIDLTSFGFTPKYTDSRIIIETSLISVHETSNISDDFRYFVVDGGGQLITWCRASSGYFNFASGYNTAVFSLRGEFASWGTEGKTLIFKADTSGSSSSSYSFNSRYNVSRAFPPFYLTVMEFI